MRLFGYYQFNREGMLNVRKSCISRKLSFWGDCRFYLVRTNAMVESVKKRNGGYSDLL